MANPTRREFLAATTVAAATASLPGQSLEDNRDLRLTFREPAKEWADSLPIGNGRLGAMVHGGTDKEILSLNEDTLWSGAPGDRNNHGAKQVLPRIRKAVLEEADYPAADELCKKMQGPFNQAYEPMADLTLTYDDTSPVTGYRRELDLDRAVATVQYERGGVTLIREAFASFPDQAIVMRHTASANGALTFVVRLASKLQATTASPRPGDLILTGKAPSVSLPDYHSAANPIVYNGEPGHGMYFATALRLEVKGGTAITEENQIRITKADSCVMRITGATGYLGYAKAPSKSAGDTVALAQSHLDAASGKPYARLLENHLSDYQTLFRRVNLRLGPKKTPDPRLTPERLQSIGAHADPALLALYFQFGRYLLIASSRSGSQPANLQGIWSDRVRPPWSCNWTANINLQMNYWPAETCNLTETTGPLFDLIEGVSENGSETARVNYGLDGWVSHHNIDLWRNSSPVGEGGGSPTWANWPMSGPWLCAHLWEHYRFTQDREFLEKRAYPLMKGAAQFCQQWLIDDGRGTLTTCPSVSTENNFKTPGGKTAEVSAGCTMDMTLIRELFSHCIEAAGILKRDAHWSALLNQARERLIPFQIGKQGQLQEWSIDFEEATPGQRHMSHLYALFPGDQITPRKTPDLAKAARKSLELRLAHGGAYTGWSRAWAIGFWARLGEGDRAEESLTMLMKHSTGPNMLDTHPASGGAIFQIDGNFGAAAAIAEMLVQSHEGEIELLPALPASWSEGSVRGLRARGGIEVDIVWENGRAASARLRSTEKVTVPVRSGVNVRTVSLEPGVSVTVRFT